LSRLFAVSEERLLIHPDKIHPGEAALRIAPL
jgi:hypothetical protein